MINKVILIGNLGRDPEVRRLENGTAVAKFSVATNESYKDKSGEWQTITEWHEIIAWRNLAERVERDLKKGKLVFVEGKLTHRKYQNKEGNDRYITEVVAHTVRLLEKRENSGTFNTNFPTEENIATPAKQSEPTAVKENVAKSTEDNLPF